MPLAEKRGQETGSRSPGEMVNCVVCLNLYRTLSGMPKAESGKKNDEH